MTSKYYFLLIAFFICFVAAFAQEHEVCTAINPTDRLFKMQSVPKGGSSVGVLPQTRPVQTGSVKAQPVIESWETFFPKFKMAVQNRDSVTIKSFLPTEIWCNHWDICKFTKGKDGTPNLIFRRWNDDKNRGWRDLKRTLDKGEIADGSYTDEAGRVYPGKWIVLRVTECNGFTMHFESYTGRWTFSRFDFGNVCP